MKATRPLEGFVGLSIAALSLLAPHLLGEDLWKDHNPYSSRASVKAGSVLKLIVDEPVLVEYEYDRNSEEGGSVKLAPDKGLTDFLPQANSSRTVSGTDKMRVKARGRVRFRMAVTVQEEQDGTLTFQGAKVIAYEGGAARTEFQVTGRLHSEDISAGRTIRSEDVADLQIVIQGAPVFKSAGIQMKQVPSGEPNRTKNSAELSDDEKQKILLDYLNRVLGEMNR